MFLRLERYGVEKSGRGAVRAVALKQSGVERVEMWSEARFSAPAVCQHCEGPDAQERAS
ncbi:MAG: hypothetical protein V4697_00835 [Patescibacteria group bacterium]